MGNRTLATFLLIAWRLFSRRYFYLWHFIFERKLKIFQENVRTKSYTVDLRFSLASNHPELLNNSDKSLFLKSRTLFFNLIHLNVINLKLFFALSSLQKFKVEIALSFQSFKFCSFCSALKKLLITFVFASHIPLLFSVWIQLKNNILLHNYSWS